jgi:hypothetical protein
MIWKPRTQISPSFPAGTFSPLPIAHCLLPITYRFLMILDDLIHALIKVKEKIEMKSASLCLSGCRTEGERFAGVGAVFRCENQNLTYRSL